MLVVCSVHVGVFCSRHGGHEGNARGRATRFVGGHSGLHKRRSSRRGLCRALRSTAAIALTYGLSRLPRGASRQRSTSLTNRAGVVKNRKPRTGNTIPLLGTNCVSQKPALCVARQLAELPKTIRGHRKSGAAVLLSGYVHSVSAGVGSLACRNSSGKFFTKPSFSETSALCAAAHGNLRGHPSQRKMRDLFDATPKEVALPTR